MEVSGDKRPPAAFEISGGDLALDLTNTRERRPTDAPVELLHSYEDVVAWGVLAGVLAGALPDALGRPPLSRITRPRCPCGWPRRARRRSRGGGTPGPRTPGPVPRPFEPSPVP